MSPSCSFARIWCKFLLNLHWGNVRMPQLHVHCFWHPLRNGNNIPRMDNGQAWNSLWVYLVSCFDQVVILCLILFPITVYIVGAIDGSYVSDYIYWSKFFYVFNDGLKEPNTCWIICARCASCTFIILGLAGYTIRYKIHHVTNSTQCQ